MKTKKKEFHPTIEMINATKDYIRVEAQYLTVEPVIHEIQRSLLAKMKFRHRETNQVITDPRRG